MYKLVFTSRFIKSARVLDKSLKLKLKSSLDIFSKNPFYPTLHTKPLLGRLSKHYSFKLGRDYRVIFRFISQDEIYLLKVGNRRDIYK